MARGGAAGATTVGTPPAVADYLAHLEVERRMSAHTLDAYRRDLAALADWAGAQGHGDLLALDSAAIRAFVASEHRRGLAPKSLQRRLSGCRSFFHQCCVLLRHFIHLIDGGAYLLNA